MTKEISERKLVAFSFELDPNDPGHENEMKRLGKLTAHSEFAATAVTHLEYTEGGNILVTLAESSDILYYLQRSREQN
ncbi:hypothetical protein ACFL0Y_03075 [Patescibacteria group bacterium]